MNLLERIMPAKIADEELFSTAHVADRRRAVAWLAERIAQASKLPPGELLSEVVTVTPAMAEVILASHNTGNRPLKPERFEYAKAMTDGRWKLTSQGISFSRDGRLNNGQNRLTAVTIAARSVKMQVTFGEDREVFDVLDTGRIRGGSDSLHVRGYKNTAQLAAAARIVWLIERGTAASNLKIANDLLLEVVKEHPELEKYTTEGHKVGKKLNTSVAAFAAAFYLISKSPNARRLPNFVSQLLTGIAAKPRDAVIVLRDGLMKRDIGVGAHNGVYITAAIILAWNKWLRGSSASLPALRWSSPAPFPKSE